MRNGVLILTLLTFHCLATEQIGHGEEKPAWSAAMVAARQSFAIADADSDRDEIAASICRRLWNDYPEMDWFMQDNPHRQAAASRFDVRREFGWYLEANRDASGEQQMIHRVLAALPKRQVLEARLKELDKDGTSPDDSRWLELYVTACQQRRQLRLKPLLLKSPQFVFTKHYTLGGSHYAYTEGQSDAQAERNFNPGAALCLLRYDGTQCMTETLLDDPGGVIRDPDISFDSQRLLFSWKKSEREDDYHLYLYWSKRQRLAAEEDFPLPTSRPHP